jgi:predicted transcriptional regulator
MSYCNLGPLYRNVQPGNHDLSLEELQNRCRACSITNPLVCKDVCDFWKLKQEYLSLRKDLPERTTTATLIAVLAEQSNREMLRTLNEKSGTLEDLQTRLGTAVRSLETEEALDSLVRVGLADLHGQEYHITTVGQAILDSVRKAPSLGLGIDEQNEKVLMLLANGTRSLEELEQQIPRIELSRILRQLEAHGVIAKDRCGKILYFATKRRPTRKLSSTELVIFKSLPKDGISPHQLSAKLNISLPKLYRYLRLLRYKRHAIRRKQGTNFELTSMGVQIVEALAQVGRIVQNLSPNNSA